MKRRTRPGPEPLDARALLSGLAYTLTTNQADYQPGQPIVMTLQSTNVSTQPVTVQDGPSIDGFTIAHDGDVIWRSNAGINPLFIRADTLQPGQSLTLSATWDGTPTGRPAPVSGQFLISNELSPQATATVTISNAAATTPGDPKTGGPAGVSPSPVGIRRLDAPSGTPGAKTLPSPATSVHQGSIHRHSVHPHRRFAMNLPRRPAIPTPLARGEHPFSSSPR